MRADPSVPFLAPHLLHRREATQTQIHSRQQHASPLDNFKLTSIKDKSIVINRLSSQEKGKRGSYSTPSTQTQSTSVSNTFRNNYLTKREAQDKKVLSIIKQHV